MKSSKSIKKENTGLIFKELEEILAKKPDLQTVNKILNEHSHNIILFLMYDRKDYETTDLGNLAKIVTGVKEKILTEYDCAVRLLTKCKEIAPDYLKNKFKNYCLPINVEKIIY